MYNFQAKKKLFPAHAEEERAREKKDIIFIHPKCMTFSLCYRKYLFCIGCSFGYAVYVIVRDVCDCFSSLFHWIQCSVFFFLHSVPLLFIDISFICYCFLSAILLLHRKFHHTTTISDRVSHYQCYNIICLKWREMPCVST